MFKVGDKVEIIKPSCIRYKAIGIVKDVFEHSGCYSVAFSDGRYFIYSEKALRLVDNLSERLTEVIKENQSLKQKIGEQNIKLNKIQADTNRELRDKQGVSDEEFREAWAFWRCTADSEILIDVYGYSTLADISDNMSLSEFVNKYKEYKQKKEIEDKEIMVGDEIKKSYDESVKGVVTRPRYIKDDFVYIMWRDGSSGLVNKADIIKTGKHYDIESILNQLKE